MARPADIDDPLAGLPAPRSPTAPAPFSPAPPPPRTAGTGGSWRQLLWFSVAAAGLGFAGYIYLVPYRQLTGVLENRSHELQQRQVEGTEAVAERDRLKTSFDKFEADEKDRAAAATKGRQTIEALEAQLKLPLMELEASVAVEEGRLRISLAPEKAIDKNGIDVSSEGNAVLKILAGAIKRSGASARIKARFGTGPAPKQLRSLFGTAGEVSAVRAARVMSALEGSGVAPERLTIVGVAESPGKEPPKPMPRGRRRRAAAAAAAAAASAPMGERLDIEVEPG